MGNLKTGQIVEAVLWIGFATFLFVYSFEFDREIEIYKFGASAWPRAILLLVVIAAIGQFLQQWKRGEDVAGTMVGQASDDGSHEAAEAAHHNTLGWYLHTFLILLVPFAYILVPDWIASAMSLEKAGLHVVKLASAAVLLLAFAFLLRSNDLGAMLALPILFAAMLQDFGFYALAPFFIIMVMYLMGERRLKMMLILGAAIYVVLLGLFVSLLYVGLPTGNISPFYEFGTGLVNILQ
jgi:hypothetical protein